MSAEQRVKVTVSNDLGIALVTLTVCDRVVVQFQAPQPDARDISRALSGPGDVLLRQAWDEGTEATYEAIDKGQLEWSRVDSQWRGRFPSNPYQP